MPGQRFPDDRYLVAQPFIIDARPPPHNVFNWRSGYSRKDRGAGRRITDTHFSGADNVIVIRETHSHFYRPDSLVFRHCSAPEKAPGTSSDFFSDESG